MSDYTISRIEDVPDQAAQFGFGEIGEARFGKDTVGAKDTGFAIHRFNPGKRSAFGHRHEQAEELAFVLEGSGTLKADEDLVEVSKGTIVRLAPPVMRAWEAGPDGMTVLVVGACHPKDGELDNDFWPVAD
jgi:quercetin dioxygenase-like cupin family protein